jgi:hypothetical protein
MYAKDGGSKVGPESLVMAYAIGGHFDKAVRAALQADLVELSQRYIRKASSVLITGEERKNLWLQVAKKLIDKNLHEALEYLLANSPLKI